MKILITTDLYEVATNGVVTSVHNLMEELEKKGLGVIGSFLLGIGMCCTMVWSTSMSVFIIGIVVGIVGMMIIAMAYPAYKKITRRQREKIADQVLALTEELCL